MRLFSTKELYSTTQADFDKMSPEDQKAWNKALLDSWTVGHPTYQGGTLSYDRPDSASKDANEYLDEMHSDWDEAREKNWNI